MSTPPVKNRSQETRYARELINRFCAPRPVEQASVWAEREFVMNEPKIKGPFTLMGREYLREIVDAWGPLPEGLKGGTDFIGCMATGTGKTIGNMAGLSFRLANDPCRALIIKPAANGPAGAKSFSKTRLQRAIRATKCLREKIPTGVFRNDFSTAQMQINGSIVDLTGSNSVGQLAENRCDIVWQDEIDKYPPQTENSKEANPQVLADERTKSVAEARRYKQSTPTLELTGIWEEFKKTDQRRYFMPCPHCCKNVTSRLQFKPGEVPKGWVVFAWSKRFSVFEQKGYEAYVKWDEKARLVDGTWDLAMVVKTAHMVCPYCQGRILNSHKHAMVSKGRWIATATGVPGYVGWHLPSMYSTTRDCDFGSMAKKFLTAKRSIDGVKGFINSDLAEPDVNQSVSVDKVGTAGRQIELGSGWITIGSFDYQQIAPYFWGVARAWNGSNKSHGVEYIACNSWDDLDVFQKKHKIIPQAFGVDVGFSQAEVLQNCANIKMPTRCTVDEAVQDLKPMINGWNPMKAFGGKKQYRDTETGLYRPYRLNPNIDPYAGTELANTVRIELLEFLSDLFEDMMDNVRNGKTGLLWTISPEVDTEEYARHMGGKIRKPKKNNPRDYAWVQRRSDWPDHLHSCELMNLVLAYRLQLISFDAIQNKIKEKK
jgi:hypothetical protein